MRRKKRFLAGVLLAAILVVGAGCSEQKEDVGSSLAPSSFWAALESQIDYTYFDTLKQLWKVTDVTIVGRIINVEEGRALGGPRDARGSVTTAMFRVRVEQVVTGELPNDSRKMLDLEILRPRLTSPTELSQAIPDQPILFLLQDVARQPQPREVDNSGVNRDPGKTLFTIPTPKALFVEDDNDVVTPLDEQEGPYEDSIKATTLEELAEEIRSFEE